MAVTVVVVVSVVVVVAVVEKAKMVFKKKFKNCTLSFAHKVNCCCCWY